MIFISHFKSTNNNPKKYIRLIAHLLVMADSSYVSFVRCGAIRMRIAHCITDIIRLLPHIKLPPMPMLMLNAGKWRMQMANIGFGSPLSALPSSLDGIVVVNELDNRNFFVCNCNNPPLHRSNDDAFLSSSVPLLPSPARMIWTRGELRAGPVRYLARPRSRWSRRRGLCSFPYYPQKEFHL